MNLLTMIVVYILGALTGGVAWDKIKNEWKNKDKEEK